MDMTAESVARKDFIEWDDYFMATAILAGRFDFIFLLIFINLRSGCTSGRRSKDPVTQVGACIVNEDKKIVGIGYNGLPFGLSDYKFPWSKDPDNPLRDKHTFVCHAEVNAILNKNCIDLKGCTLYVALFPCNECAKMIIQSRIKDIIFLSDKHKYKQKTVASKIMLDEAGIPYKQFVPKQRKIVIDFDEIDYNAKKLNEDLGTMKL